MSVQLKEKINISVETLENLSEVDLADLCNITEQAIDAGGGFGWIRVPTREILNQYWIKITKDNLNNLVVGRLNGVIAGTLQLSYEAPNIESRKNVIVVPEVVGKYTSVNVTEGQFVEKGTTLARINSDVFDNNLNEIKSNLDLLKTIFERQANLWQNNIGSEIDYLRAKSNYESIKSRYNATRLQVSKFEVIAPFSGIVDEVNVKVGEMASPTIPSFRILNESEYFLSVDVSENYINSFSIQDTVKVISNNKEIYLSKIISISKVVNPINRTFNVGIEIPNELREEIKPNQILNALLIDYKNNNSLSVSSNIIFNDDRGSYVFIISDFDGEMIARKIPVLTGKSFKYQTEILSGLIGDELIIDKGSTEVMDGSYVKIKN